MPGEEALDLAVERQGPQGLPLRQAGAGRAESLLEREIDSVEHLDRHRIAQHGIAPAGLARAVVERPQERLGDALKLDRHAHVSLASADSKPPIEGAKSAETRQRRIAKSVTALQEGRT